MPGDELSAENRTKLDGIVQQMTDNKESDDAILLVVNDFKSKYSVKKKESTTSNLPSATGDQIEQNLQPQLEGGSLGSVKPASALQAPFTNPTTPEYQQQTTNLMGDPIVTEKPVSITANQKIPTSTQSVSTAGVGGIATGLKSKKDVSLTAEEVKNSILAGSSALGSMILRSPAYLLDMASNSLGVDAKPVSEQLSEDLGLPKENRIADYYDKVAANNAQTLEKKYGASIDENFQKGDYIKGFSLLANGVLQSAPTTIALATANAAGVGLPGTIMGGTIAFGAANKEELKKAHPELDENTLNQVSAANGFFEGAFENLFGVTKLGGLTKNIFLKEGEKVAKETAEKGFKEMYAPLFRKYLGPGMEEPLGEMATKFAQNAVEKFSGVDPDKDLMEGVKDAGWIGLASGTGFAAIPTALDVARTKTAVKKANDIAEQRNSIVTDLQSQDVSPEVKPALVEKLKSLNEEDAVLHQQEKEKHEALPEEKKAEVDALLEKAHTLTSSVIDPTISESTREIMKSDLDAIENQVEKIYEEKKETKTEEAVTPEADAAIHDTFLEAFKNDLTQDSVTTTEAVTPTAETTETVVQPVNETPVVESTNPIVNEIQQGPAVVDQSQQSTEKISDKSEETKPVKKKQTQELIDEDEQIEARKPDDAESVKKLNDDIAILKGFNDKDLASKKFKGVIERAFKMKEENKISKPTYTKYRNIASQVLGPKVNLDAEKAKFHVEQMKEEVKKKLLGEGYKKIVMTAPGFGPKQVADLIDLTAKMVNHAIDAGFTVSEATAKALEKIKTHPYYQKLIDEGHVDEKSFAKSVTSTFEKAEEKPEKVAENTESPKKEAKINTKKEKRTHAIGERMVENESKFKDVSKRLKERGIEYEAIDQKKATQAISAIIEEHSKDSLLSDLADQLIEGKSEIPYALQGLAAAKLVDKLNVMAEKEENQFLKEATFDKAAELSTWWMQEATKAGQFNGVANQEIANSLPMSKEGLRTFAQKEIEKLHDTLLTEEEKAQVEKASEEINKVLSEDVFSDEHMAMLETMVTKEIARITSKVKGKEFVDNLSTAMDSLKLDLSDC